MITLGHPTDPRRLPPLIAVCLTIDLFLAMMFLVSSVAGEFSYTFTFMFHLEQEGNLPTWFSSLQLFAVAGLFAIFARCHFDRRILRSWVLLVLPLVVLMMSIDEASQFHERVAAQIDRVLMPGGHRRGTSLPFTGLWVVVIGVPFLAFLVSLIRYLRGFFAVRPQVTSRLILGTVVFLAGAVGIESTANFVPVDSVAHEVEVFFEELFEMVGVTIILWGAVDLLHAEGFVVDFRRRAVGRSGTVVPAPIETLPPTSR